MPCTHFINVTLAIKLFFLVSVAHLSLSKKFLSIPPTSCAGKACFHFQRSQEKILTGGQSASLHEMSYSNSAPAVSSFSGENGLAKILGQF